MGDLCLLAANLLNAEQALARKVPPVTVPQAQPSDTDESCHDAIPGTTPAVETFDLEFRSLRSPAASPALTSLDSSSELPNVGPLNTLKPAPPESISVERSLPALATPPSTSASQQPSAPLSAVRPSPSLPAVPDLMPLPMTPTYPAPSTVPLTTPRPVSGSQLYQQRWTALQAGRTYTRLPANSFQTAWVNATQQPTYEQWVNLLGQEARAMARGQGSNRLTAILGDSLSLWIPPEHLSSDRFWLNQGISGDTTTGVLRRLSALDQTRPNVIHVMVGINDLRQGRSDAEILSNLQQIMRQLRQRHPQSQIYIHSILPTRFSAIPGDRIRQINQAIASLTWQEGVSYLDVQSDFTDAQGNLRADLTTDGLHLNANGYAMWRPAFL